MNFRLKIVSCEYLDDVPTIRHEYAMKDAIEFAEIVQSSMSRISDMLKFDTDYRGTFQVELKVFVDNELRATQYFRRSESENSVITSWRVCNY